MKHAVAVQAHTIPDRPPLRINTGEAVTVGQRDTEWPAFVFITTATGSGWVPSCHVSSPAGPGVALTPYDTTELPTEVGEVLEVVTEDIASGWLWCRSSSGREGWVPISSVCAAEDQTSP